MKKGGVKGKKPSTVAVAGAVKKKAGKKKIETNEAAMCLADVLDKVSLPLLLASASFNCCVSGGIETAWVNEGSAGEEDGALQIL